MNIFRNILVAGIIGVITLLSGVCVGLPSCYLFTNPTQIKIKDMEANTEEVWKDIKGYEGLYQVSNRGRVKSLERYIKRGIHGIQYSPERIRKQSQTHDGYQIIILSKNKIKTTNRVNRIVADAFIPNPNNKPQVNHINNVRDDNRVENLEWVTASENQKYSYITNNRVNSNLNRFGIDNPLSKCILQYSADNKFIKKFYGIRDAERKTGINSGCITKCCKNKRKIAGGFIWKYEDDVNDKNIKYAT